MLVADGPTEFKVQTPAFKECKKIFEEAGETFSGDEASNKEAQIPGYCDTAWYFQAASMLKAGTDPDASSRGMNGVATDGSPCRRRACT